jgi:hypothetical protein
MYSGRYERPRLTAFENMPRYIEKPPRLGSAAIAYSSEVVWLRFSGDTKCIGLESLSPHIDAGPT